MDLDRPSREISRRQSLVTVAALATGGIAGCSSMLEQNGISDSGATDVIVYNAASESRRVSVRITAESAETAHTSRTVTLTPGEVIDSVNSAKLPTTTSSYTVEVTVEDGPSETFQWTDPSVELSPLWVRIDGTRNIKFLLQAG